MAYQFSTDPLLVSEGDIIQFQYKAPDTWNTTETVTIQVGLLTQFWFITTIPEDFEPDPFPLKAVRDADLNTVYTYGDGLRPGEQIITVSGLTPGTIVPVSLSANDFPSIDRYSISIDGGPFITLPDNTTVQNGSTIQLRARTFNGPAQTLRLNLTIGLGNEIWVLTTKQTPGNFPVPPPVFTRFTNLPLSSSVYSNIVVVQGLSSPGLVSAGFGTLVAASNSNISTTNANGYDVLNGVTFTSSLTISNGQYLQLLGTSSASANTQIDIGVDIGDGIGISSWRIITGAALSTTPNNFNFPNATNVAPNTVIESAARPVGGITGLASGVSVPVELISTSGSQPRVKINNGSIGVFPTTVVNGDTITLYNISADLGGNVETLIKVGARIITTWSIDTYLAPDSTPSFTPPPSLVNRVPDTFITSAVVGLTDFNVPITITATNGALISIDYDTPSVGPRTFDPLVNSLIFLVVKTPNSLNATASTTVTLGDAPPFTWSVTTYAVAPPPPSNLGTWYSIKTNKYDGFSIGTVVQILKENVVTEYGNIQDRFPGFLECNGGSYAVAQYPDLWNVIGNTYGGSGAYDSGTKIYSGSFNVPDYRNKRLCGIGQVDQNSGGSAFLPVTTGGINQVGSRGGFWFIDRSGVAGPLPLEQVFTGGTTSDFFSLGTVRTFGAENLVSEIDFTVSGSINATIGKTGETAVNVPIHEHRYWSSATENDGGEPLIPWGKFALYRFDPGSARTDEIGTFTDNAVPIATRTPGTYTPGVDEKGARFEVIVASVPNQPVGQNGGAVTVTMIDSGTNYGVGQQIILPAAATGFEGIAGSDIIVTITSIIAGDLNGQTPPGVGSRTKSTKGRIKDGQETVQLENLIKRMTGSEFIREVTLTGLRLSDIYVQSGSQVTAFGNWWASPLATLTSLASSSVTNTTFVANVTNNSANITAITPTSNLIPGMVVSITTGGISVPVNTTIVSITGNTATLSNVVTGPSGSATFIVVVPFDPGTSKLYSTGAGASDAGVIDTKNTSMRIDPYLSPGVLRTHSHLMSLDAATNPQTDFTLGNTNSHGTKYAQSLPTANETLAVGFNQSQVLLELSSATFTFNTQIKPIPLVEMVPNKIVPLLTPFHKVKYIIKAY